MNVHTFHPDDVIDTNVGPVRVGDMTKKLGGHDNKRELCSWREFWYNGVMVRRDVSIQLKTVEAESRIGVFFRNAGVKVRDLRRRLFPNPGEFS